MEAKDTFVMHNPTEITCAHCGQPLPEVHVDTAVITRILGERARSYFDRWPKPLGLGPELEEAEAPDAGDQHREVRRG